MRREFWDEMEDYFAMQKVKLHKKKGSAQGGRAAGGAGSTGGSASAGGTALASGAGAAGGKAAVGSARAGMAGAGSALAGSKAPADDRALAAGAGSAAGATSAGGSASADGTALAGGAAAADAVGAGSEASAWGTKAAAGSARAGMAGAGSAAGATSAGAVGAAARGAGAASAGGTALASGAGSADGAGSAGVDGAGCEGFARAVDGRALGAMYRKRHYQKHREKIRQSQREYLAANLERCREAGARLRAARLARGWTQAQLGRALGVSKAAVCHWERGRVPFDAQRLARRLPRLMADVSPGAGRTGQGQAQNAAADEAKPAPQTGPTGNANGLDAQGGVAAGHLAGFGARQECKTGKAGEQPETGKACPGGENTAAAQGGGLGGTGAGEILRKGLADGRDDNANGLDTQGGEAGGHLAGFGAKQECATAEAQNLRKGRGDDEQGA